MNCLGEVVPDLTLLFPLTSFFLYGFRGRVLQLQDLVKARESHAQGMQATRTGAVPKQLHDLRQMVSPSPLVGPSVHPKPHL